MIAVGAGDSIAARRYAGEAERLLGREPLALLLKAQAAQVSGDRAAAEAAFSRMMDDDETRVLGLRGLFVEARRRQDPAAARAMRSRRCASRRRLLGERRRARSALCRARLARRPRRGRAPGLPRPPRQGDGQAPPRRAADRRCPRPGGERPRGALASAQEAVKLAPDLVPAAALAGRFLSHSGDLRRAAKLVEAAWKSTPHPDLAEVYVNLRPAIPPSTVSPRAETLQRLRTRAEGRLAVARAAMEAREFDRARAALEPLAVRAAERCECACIMSDLEQTEHGNTGRAANGSPAPPGRRATRPGSPMASSRTAGRRSRP